MRMHIGMQHGHLYLRNQIARPHGEDLNTKRNTRPRDPPTLYEAIYAAVGSPMISISRRKSPPLMDCRDDVLLK